MFEITLSCSLSAEQWPGTASLLCTLHVPLSGEHGSYQTVKPDSGTDFQAKVLATFSGVSSSFGSGTLNRLKRSPLKPKELSLSFLNHPGGKPWANLKSISHKCHLILVAFVWELTKATVNLPLGCLQGGAGDDPPSVAGRVQTGYECGCRLHI